MLTVEQSAELITEVRDRVRDGDDTVDILREKGVNPEAFVGLRAISGLTFGQPGIALVEASVLAGVTLGQAALQEQPSDEAQSVEA